MAARFLDTGKRRVLFGRAMCPAPSCVAVAAPAKINLFLDVVGRRADGYHDLQSIVMPIDVCDEITLRVLPEGVSLETEWGARPPDDAPAAEENLAVKAARALQAASGCKRGVQIRLRKVIPMGGGMGGGSADAAAVLRTLNVLWELDWPLERLQEIGLTLGCDVPAMVCGRAVLMEGKGERVTPLRLEPDAVETAWWVVVVNPGFPVSTPDIYCRYKPGLTPPRDAFTTIRFALERGRWTEVARGLFNALQETAFAKYPSLALLAVGLRNAGARGVLLSGSGASLFGLAETEEEARAVEARIRLATGPWLWSRAARMLPDGVMAAHGPLEARV